MNQSLSTALLLTGLATGGLAVAKPPADLAIEPCMNGEVSADGTLPSCELAELRAAYEQLAKPNQHPFYTFMVAGRVVVQEP
jgi:hypothetical protein